jgi:hypothetical protein
LKKRTKKLLIVNALAWFKPVRKIAKVFASFFKKKRFLAPCRSVSRWVAAGGRVGYRAGTPPWGNVFVD